MKQYKNILILLFLLLITFINQTYNFIELNLPFNFKNKDYLSLLNGALFADVFIILLLIQYNYISGKYIKLWYKKYHIFALIADIGSIILGVIIARYVIYKLKLKILII